MVAGVRFGAIAGVIAFASTLAANLAILLLRPADLCRVGPLVIPVLMLGAALVFLLLAAAAGFAAGRADGTVPSAALAGLLVGAVSGCALVALIPFGSAMMHRLMELSTLCPDGGSFSIGTATSPPPGFLTPPPGFTPPPGGFAPPPGAFTPPSGIAGVALQVTGILFGVGFGAALATGAAALAGLVGIATRPREPAG